MMNPMHLEDEKMESSGEVWPWICAAFLWLCVLVCESARIVRVLRRVRHRVVGIDVRRPVQCPVLQPSRARVRQRLRWLLQRPSSTHASSTSL